MVAGKAVPRKGLGERLTSSESRGPQWQALFQKQQEGEQQGRSTAQGALRWAPRQLANPQGEVWGGAGEQGRPQGSLGGPQPAEEA